MKYITVLNPKFPAFALFSLFLFFTGTSPLKANSLGFPATAGGSPPVPSAVGPRVPLENHPGAYLEPGEYRSLRFAEPVTLGKSGTYAFVDCLFLKGFGAVDGRGMRDRSVSLDHCALDEGLFFEYGGQSNWTIRWTRITGWRKAFRPTGAKGQNDTSTPTPCLVEDSILSITFTGTPENHVDTMQSLGGNGLIFIRVRFTTPGPYIKGNSGQTSSVNNGSENSLFDSCEFLSEGAFYYSVYSKGESVLFRNCRIASGLAGYLYPNKGGSGMPYFSKCTDYRTGELIR